MKNKIFLIVQPILTSYRRSFFNDFAKYFQQVDIYSIQNINEGFKSDIEGNFNKIHTPLIGNRAKIYYQKGIVYSILKNRPSVIFITADFRALHFWILLFLSKVFKIPFFSHGQGLYNKPRPSLLQIFMFKIVTRLSNRYVCYTKSVYNSLIDIGINQKKLSVMDNTLVNKYPVYPTQKTNFKHRLFYVGRLREGCNVELLFEAMLLLKNRGILIGLDIVGDGVQRGQLEISARDKKLDVSFFGAIYEDKKISELSQKCSIGVYPGDAGLSIVHYMSLSLIPVIHDDLTKHMGPEPSYINAGINGVTFKRDNSTSLADAIECLLSNQRLSAKLSVSAFDTYVSLSKPTMAEKLIDIMKPYLKENIIR